jgi:hypothetical protein
LARHISQGTPVFLDYDQLELDDSYDQVWLKSADVAVEQNGADLKLRKTKDRPASLPMPSKSPAFRLRATEELSAELRWLARA